LFEKSNIPKNLQNQDLASRAPVSQKQYLSLQHDEEVQSSLDMARRLAVFISDSSGIEQSPRKETLVSMMRSSVEVVSALQSEKAWSLTLAHKSWHCQQTTK